MFRLCPLFLTSRMLNRLRLSISELVLYSSYTKSIASFSLARFIHFPSLPRRESDYLICFGISDLLISPDFPGPNAPTFMLCPAAQQNSTRIKQNKIKTSIPFFDTFSKNSLSFLLPPPPTNGFTAKMFNSTSEAWADIPLPARRLFRLSQSVHSAPNLPSPKPATASSLPRKLLPC